MTARPAGFAALLRSLLDELSRLLRTGLRPARPEAPKQRGAARRLWTLAGSLQPDPNSHPPHLFAGGGCHRGGDR